MSLLDLDMKLGHKSHWIYNELVQKSLSCHGNGALTRSIFGHFLGNDRVLAHFLSKNKGIKIVPISLKYILRLYVLVSILFVFKNKIKLQLLVIWN